MSQTYPFDGESKNSWRRLKEPLVRHRVPSSTLPCYKFKRRPVHLLAPFQKPTFNAALAIIEAAAPKTSLYRNAYISLAIHIRQRDLV